MRTGTAPPSAATARAGAAPPRSTAPRPPRGGCRRSRTPPRGRTSGRPPRGFPPRRAPGGAGRRPSAPPTPTAAPEGRRSARAGPRESPGPFPTLPRPRSSASRLLLPLAEAVLGPVQEAPQVGAMRDEEQQRQDRGRDDRRVGRVEEHAKRERQQARGGDRAERDDPRRA